MAAVSIRSELRPGDLGRLIALHGVVYAGEPGVWGLDFEAYVARTVADFVIDNEARGRAFLAEDAAGALVGRAALVERRREGRLDGQLRWVVLAHAARGWGIGGRLVDAALDHARAAGCARVFLEATAGLDASMALYRKRGFEIVSARREKLWTGEDQVIIMERVCRP